MFNLFFSVNVLPVPQPRPRATAFVAKNGKPQGRVYDDPNNPVMAYRYALRKEAEELMGVCEPTNEPLKAIVAFCFARPESHFRKGKKTSHLLTRAAPLFPSKKSGDIDNLLKSTFDALNGIVYVDDSQIVEVEASRTYEKRSNVTIKFETSRIVVVQ